MRKFIFRLQRVLEFREVTEQKAEDAYRAAQARRIESEQGRVRFGDLRQAALRTVCDNVDQMKSLERYIERIDDEERAHEVIVALLVQEEAMARQVWLDRRAEAEAMRKLRQHAREQWQLDADRAEQAEMDEFAINRRRAA